MQAGDKPELLPPRIGPSFPASLEGTPNEIHLVASDSGIGFNPRLAMNNGHGLGLISMRERMKLVDGRLSISSGREHGTTIQACVPFSPKSCSGTDNLKGGKYLRSSA